MVVQSSSTVKCGYPAEGPRNRPGVRQLAAPELGLAAESRRNLGTSHSERVEVGLNLEASVGAPYIPGPRNDRSAKK